MGETAEFHAFERRRRLVMENLAAHKGPRVEEMIKAAGAELRYLPPDSPDTTPDREGVFKTESSFAQIAERTVAALMRALEICAEIFIPPNVQKRLRRLRI